MNKFRSQRGSHRRQDGKEESIKKSFLSVSIINPHHFLKASHGAL
jgi:hypothetical protein